MDTLILAPQHNQADKTLGETYLRFQLEPASATNLSIVGKQEPILETPFENRESSQPQKLIAALPIENVQEVLVVPKRRITLMPNMPECVMGLLNRRNQILWVIDLAQLLKLKTLEPNLQQYNVIITKVGSIPLGLVVPEIKGVARVTSSMTHLESGLVTSSLKPYICGCIQEQQELLLILNAEAIVRSPTLNIT